MSAGDLDNRTKGAILIALLAALFLLGPYFGIRLVAGTPEPLTPLQPLPKRVESNAAPQPEADIPIEDEEQEPGEGLKGIEDLLQ